MTNISIGVSDFSDIVKSQSLLVDKTLFIRDIILDTSQVILITRPRRFGKSLNMSMLHYFFNIDINSKDLFSGLKMSTHEGICQEWQNTRPVISFSLKDLASSNYSAFLRKISLQISQLYGKYEHIVEFLSEYDKNSFHKIRSEEQNDAQLECSLKLLSGYLCKYYEKKVIILIDEYDTPMQQSYLNEYYEEMTMFMRNFLGLALKDNEYLEKAVVTGIMRISKENLFSGLNNINVYSMLSNKYSECFGFTDEEVQDLFNKCNNADKMDEARSWYNGYQIGHSRIYNPWSIMCYLQNGCVPKSYWVNTSSNDLAKKTIQQNAFSSKNEIEQLIKGQVVTKSVIEHLVFSDLDRNPSAVWSLLFHSGYLNVLSFDTTDGYILRANLSIPNREVLSIYENAILEYFTSDAMDYDDYLGFIESVRNANVVKFREYVSTYLLQSGSFFDFNKHTPEKVFHAFMLGIVSGLRNIYDIESNREAGKGRADMVFVPKNASDGGIILEFKVADSLKKLESTAKDGVNQIKSMNYLAKFSKYTKVTVIGISFFEKDVATYHEIIPSVRLDCPLGEQESRSESL